MAKRRSFPLDLKTGRLVFTPVLRSTGERLDLEVDYNALDSAATAFYVRAYREMWDSEPQAEP